MLKQKTIIKGTIKDNKMEYFGGNKITTVIDKNKYKLMVLTLDRPRALPPPGPPPAEDDG